MLQKALWMSVEPFASLLYQSSIFVTIALFYVFMVTVLYRPLNTVDIQTTIVKVRWNYKYSVYAFRMVRLRCSVSSSVICASKWKRLLIIALLVFVAYPSNTVGITSKKSAAFLPNTRVIRSTTIYSGIIVTFC